MWNALMWPILWNALNRIIGLPALDEETPGDLGVGAWEEGSGRGGEGPQQGTMP